MPPNGTDVPGHWTRESPSLIGMVTTLLDYMVPVVAVRAKVEEIARSTRPWSGKLVNVQVTEFRESAMEVHILVSSSN